MAAARFARDPELLCGSEQRLQAPNLVEECEARDFVTPAKEALMTAVSSRWSWRVRIGNVAVVALSGTITNAGTEGNIPPLAAEDDEDAARRRRRVQHHCTGRRCRFLSCQNRHGRRGACDRGSSLLERDDDAARRRLTLKLGLYAGGAPAPTPAGVGAELSRAATWMGGECGTTREVPLSRMPASVPEFVAATLVR